MIHRGTVEQWHEEDGWGVLRSPELDEPVWAHFSHIDATGYRTLQPGAEVRFTVEPADQDGYRLRATWVK